jgi:hypothetical protein
LPETVNQQQDTLDLIGEEYFQDQPANNGHASQGTTTTLNSVDLSSSSSNLALQVEQVLLSARFVHSDLADIEKIVSAVRDMQKKEEEKTLEHMLGASAYNQSEGTAPTFATLSNL